MKRIISLEENPGRKCVFCGLGGYNVDVMKYYSVHYYKHHPPYEFNCCLDCYIKHIFPLINRPINIFTRKHGVRISR